MGQGGGQSHVSMRKVKFPSLLSLLFNSLVFGVSHAKFLSSKLLEPCIISDPFWQFTENIDCFTEIGICRKVHGHFFWVPRQDVLVKVSREQP